MPIRAPAERPAVERLRVVGPARTARRRRVVRIGLCALEDAEQDGGVGDAARHRAGGVLVGGDRDDAVAADSSDGRLDRHQLVGVRRAEDRSGGLGADVRGPEARRGAGPRARAAGGERRAAVEVGLTWITPRIVRVETVAVEGVVVGRHAGWPGDPVGELGHLRLGENDGARRAQVRDQRRLVRRDEAGERQRAAGGRHVRGVDVVLERDRDAVQGTAHLPARRSRSRASASSRACGFTAIVALIRSS